MINTNAGAGALNTREIVLDMLFDICEKGEYSHIVLRQTLRKYQYLDKRDRAFITRITEGTIENRILLDYIIDKFSKVKVKKMKPLIRNLLRMSIYQIMFMDSVPVSAACNEAVKLAIKRSFGQLRGFVNGVLRAVIREKDNIKYPNASENLIEYFNVVYSMPEWIVEQLFVQYGAEEASRIIKAMSEHDDSICVRANAGKAKVEETIKMLEAEEIEVIRSTVYENCLYLKNVDYLENIQAFNEGYISVQDLSSMLVAVIANPKKDDLCMDLCAAPGGKALHLWELMNGSGKVIARDISENKVGLIEENIDRTEAYGVVAQVYDAIVLDESMIEKADIVIADLPCSGLGIIGKKSDIKYNITCESQKELVKLQRQILENAWQYVKVGGTLVYSTCTLNKEENIENVKFIESKFPLKRVDISSFVPTGFCDDTAKEGYIQMLPGINGTDGFFISRFERY